MMGNWHTFKIITESIQRALKNASLPLRRRVKSKQGEIKPVFVSSVVLLETALTLHVCLDIINGSTT